MAEIKIVLQKDGLASNESLRLFLYTLDGTVIDPVGTILTVVDPPEPPSAPIARSPVFVADVQEVIPNELLSAVVIGPGDLAEYQGWLLPGDTLVDNPVPSIQGGVDHTSELAEIKNVVDNIPGFDDNQEVDGRPFKIKRG